MSALIPFSCDGFAIEAILRDGEPWFVLNRVVKCLNIGHAPHVASRLPDDEKDAVVLTDSAGRPNQMTVVNEFGLYRCVLSSRKPDAERFKTWIVREVLPAIRKTGGYGQPTAAPNLRDPATMAAFATQLVEINQELNGKLSVAEAQVERLRPKAAAFEALAESDSLYTLQNAGRILNSNGHKIGPNGFVTWLKDRGVLFYQDGALVPYNRFVSQGLFKLKLRDAKGKDRVQTYVTARGIAHFHAMLSPQRDLLSIDRGAQCFETLRL